MACPSTSAPVVQDALTRARKQAERGEWAAAIDSYDLAVQELQFPRGGSGKPDAAAAAAVRVEQALVHWRLKQFPRAIACADEALAPDRAGQLAPAVACDAHAVRGLVFHAEGRLDLARVELDAARRSGGATAAAATLAEMVTQRAWHLEAGRQKLASRDWQGAFEQFDLAGQILPDAVALEGRGSALLALQRRDEALADFDRGLQLGPPRWRLRLLRGNALFELRRYDEAVAELERFFAMPYEHTSASALRNTGLETHLEAMVAANIDQVQAGYTATLLLANCYAAMRPPKHDLALRYFNEFLGVHPDDAAALEGRAQVHYAMGQYDRAHADLARAEQAGSRRAAELRRLGDAAYGLVPGRAKEATALEELQAAIRREEERRREVVTADLAKTAARLGLGDPAGLEEGYGHYLAERHEQAVECWDKAVATTPTQLAGRYFRAGSLRALGRFELALADGAEAARLAPENAAVRIELGEIHLAMERPDQALAELHRAVQFAPENALAHATRGWVFDVTGDLRSAARDYARAIALGSVEPWAWNALAWIKVSGEVPDLVDTKEALALARRALELAPDDAAILDTLACALAENGDFPRAIEAEGRALERCTDANLRATLEQNLAGFKAGKTYRARVEASSKKGGGK